MLKPELTTKIQLTTQIAVGENLLLFVFMSRRVLVLLSHTRLFLDLLSFNNFTVLMLKKIAWLKNGLFKRFFRHKQIKFPQKDVGPILTHSCRGLH